MKVPDNEPLYFLIGAMAAGPGQCVVSTQPQSQTLVENGEQIVMEAVCDSENLKKVTCGRCFWAGVPATMIVGLLPGVCWCVIGIPLGRYLGQRAADSWRLYLTSTALHYREQRNQACTCCSSAEDTGMRHVDLSDVEDITVEMSYVEGSLCGCDSKTLPTTVNIVLKPGRRHDLLPRDWCNRPLDGGCLNSITSESSINLTLNHCINAADFVKAVKERMVPSDNSCYM